MSNMPDFGIQQKIRGKWRWSYAAKTEDGDFVDGLTMRRYFVIGKTKDGRRLVHQRLRLVYHGEDFWDALVDEFILALMDHPTVEA